MPELRASALVDAPVSVVAGALLDTSLITGFGVRVPGPLLCAGDELTGPFGVRLTVTRADLSGVSAAGDFLELHTDLVVTGAGTMVVDRVGWTSVRGVVGRFADMTVGRGTALRVLEKRSALLARRCAELRSARVVVGAAIVRGGRLLAQQRSFPETHAGQWELPGGRVEPGEKPVDALVRECVEELGVPVVVGERVGPDVPLKRDLVLRIFSAELAGGEPEALEHNAVRWVTAGELPGLPWLPADRVLVPALQQLLN
ncbi:(deoxy)nucleoside triphosphate pyrophosphohydrolase [Lentzea sp. CC55]|uniref:(deoxy)nucleoside triphosphate pyrophosphohydrolase n=1 Tax=Lentzea sp. CC55 TaxID=2884909 RepID=UPI0027E1991B|nr:(deoxy)nucleoside triphosphate pyrophosphohydrolase [Lentzea sp. CC55]MCG8923956.1 (deoxy)nucleoside triphosphate pyrophosphohydrolase [Lentzea sp. CC55]